MKRELERARQETTGLKVYVLTAYYFLTSNYSLMVLLFGVGMIGFGATVFSGRPAFLFEGLIEHDVFAGMFGVWGASLAVIGGLAYSVLWANKIYARLTDDTGADREPEPETETETETL